jgi:hypothetical protein
VNVVAAEPANLERVAALIGLADGTPEPVVGRSR